MGNYFILATNFKVKIMRFMLHKYLQYLLNPVAKMLKHVI